MDSINNQIFKFKNKTLEFEQSKSILLCKNSYTGKNVWAKKINDTDFVSDVIEDTENFLVNAVKDEKRGQFLALDKNTGSTSWYISGRSFFQLIYNKFLYLIFIDNNDKFFLIKVNKADGNKIWFHEIERDLKEYTFKNDAIHLIYNSGKVDKLSSATGLITGKNNI